MKKEYIQPQAMVYEMTASDAILAGSWNDTKGVESLHGMNGGGTSALGRDDDGDWEDEEF